MDKTAILLIEDNEDNAAIYTLCLEHFGHRVARAADGAEGVRLARETNPGLIVLDISLPVLSGWDVAEILRAEARTAQIPIIVCTAHDTAADHTCAARLGCEGYLAKPCPPRTLLAEVERLLEVSAARSVRSLGSSQEPPSRWSLHTVRRAALGLALGAALLGIRVGLGARIRRSVRRLQPLRIGGAPTQLAGVTG
jgi:DNA-binding response OmpR family regulator